MGDVDPVAIGYDRHMGADTPADGSHDLEDNPERIVVDGEELRADTEPLFDMIDRQGDPAVPTEGKVRPVFVPGPILRELGVEPRLAEQVDEVALYLRPLGALVLARRPDQQENDALQGRGSFHEDIPVGDVSATVYNKGTGNEGAFEDASDAFPGYPSTVERLFYDPLGGRTHPRLLGTETMRWGLMEAVNAAFVFAHVAKSKGWTDISQAIESGVTIPLNVLHLPELSAHMGRLIEQYKANGVTIIDKRAVRWEGNDHLGVVSMIVPSSTRLVGVIGDPHNAIARLAGTEATRVTADTLRALINAGFCFSESSSHRQNLYDRGVMAQADNSDLVTLGDYKGVTGVEPGAPAPSAEQQRRALVFMQFERKDYLVPPHGPAYADDVSMTWSQVKEVGEVFWPRMLEGLADPEATRRMVKYLPLLRTEFNAAAAQLLIETGDSAYWEQVADQKQAVLAQYGEAFGVLGEYQAKLKENLPVDTLPEELDHVMRQGILRSQPILDYLRTGDERFLRQDPIVAKAVALIDAIDAVQDPEMRDDLVALSSFIFAGKSIMTMRSNPDIVTAFEGRQYDLLRELVQAGRLEDASAALRVMAIIRDGWSGEGIGGYYSAEGDGEVNTHKFLRKLLEPGVSYEDLLEEARLELRINRMSVEAQGGGYELSDLLRYSLRKKAGEQQEDIFWVGEPEGHPAHPCPAEVVKLVLLTYRHSVPDRRAISQWIEDYQKVYGSLADAQNVGQRTAVLEQLDEMASSVAGSYPELTFAHHCVAAGRYASLDKTKAQWHFDQAMAYYATHLHDRASRVPAPIHEWDSFIFARDPGLKEAWAKEYDRLGLPLVAAYYRGK